MVEYQNKVRTNCISPKGTKYNSPGQGRMSAARQAAALGLCANKLSAERKALQPISTQPRPIQNSDLISSSVARRYVATPTARTMVLPPFQPRARALGYHILPLQGNFAARVGYLTH